MKPLPGWKLRIDSISVRVGYNLDQLGGYCVGMSQINVAKATFFHAHSCRYRGIRNYKACYLIQKGQGGYDNESSESNEFWKESTEAGITFRNEDFTQSTISNLIVPILSIYKSVLIVLIFQISY